MLSITIHWGRVNQNYDDTTSHPLGHYYQKTEEVEKLEPLCTVGGSVKWCSHCGKQYGASSKQLK